MRVYCIVDCKGKLIAAYPAVGIAKIHCRKEIKDRVVVGDLMLIESTCTRPKKGGRQRKPCER